MYSILISSLSFKRLFYLCCRFQGIHLCKTFAKSFNKNFVFVRQKFLIFERIKKFKEDIYFVNNKNL